MVLIKVISSLEVLPLLFSSKIAKDSASLQDLEGTDSPIEGDLLVLDRQERTATFVGNLHCKITDMPKVSEEAHQPFFLLFTAKILRKLLHFPHKEIHLLELGLNSC